jgi:hypothetical protein
MIEQVEVDPVLPVWWGKNQAGMQAKEELSWDEQAQAGQAWLEARNVALHAARRLMEIGVHKQVVNRMLEPWMWITTIISATEWENFFRLRCAPDAQPELQKLALMMRAAMEAGVPEEIGPFGWHLPLIREEDLREWRSFNLPTQDLVKVSIGRCARVSYLTHDGKRDLSADVALCDRLKQDGHWSPFEHAARPLKDPLESSGNFYGWQQYRSLVELGD